MSPQDVRYASQAPQTVYPVTLSLIDALRDDRVITIGALAESFDVPRRAIEKGIEELKRSGYPVICSSRGCWRATTVAELQQAYRSERSRALGQLRNARGRLKAIAALQKVEPLTLWDAA